MQQWWTKDIRYNLSNSNQRYTAKMIIPAYYSVFNKTIVTATFIDKGVNTLDLPYISKMEISPRFKEGQELRLNIVVDASILTIDSYYNEGRGWKKITLIKNANDNKFTGMIVPNQQYVNLKINLTNIFGNSQQYEIYPVSVKEKN